jgi:hypothetical protein
MERTAGTSKLIAIALRRIRAPTGDLRLTLEGVLVGLRSRVCSSELPPERENARGWSLRVEDEHSGEVYLLATRSRGILDLFPCCARVGRGGSDGYGNCSHDNQGIVQRI